MTNFPIPPGVLAIARPVICHFEASDRCHLQSYVLPSEIHLQATIGWGTAIPLSKHPMTCTQAEADQWMADAIQIRYNKFCARVPLQVIAKMTDAQVAAFLSWSYNAVDSCWTSDSFRKLCAGDVLGWITGACEWDNHDMAGLVRRRAVERHLVERGEIEMIRGPLNWYRELIPQVERAKRVNKTGHLAWMPDQSKLYWKVVA